MDNIEIWAALIVDGLVTAGIVQEKDTERAIEVTTEELQARMLVESIGV